MNRAISILARSCCLLAIAPGWLAGARAESVALRWPNLEQFEVAPAAPSARAAVAGEDWVPARRVRNPGEGIEFGRRIVLQTRLPDQWRQMLDGGTAVLAREIRPDLVILEASDARKALREAERLAALPEVRAAYPVVRRQVDRLSTGGYAPAPSDPHFPPMLGNTEGQWYLENRDTATGERLGMDLNVRGAWAVTRGGGITVAVADTGVEVSHPDLADRTGGAPHKDFNDMADRGTPLQLTASWAHGTECAGLIAATADNGVGISGVAPEVRLAGWVIFATNDALVSDEHVMDMFRYQSNQVQVQNHSWSHVGSTQTPLTPAEDVGVQDAFEKGRNGKGVVLVRSAGNDHESGSAAGDSGYGNDPRVVCVGAVGRNGRVAEYSERGANVLVAAPSGTKGGNGLMTTDLTGTNGANSFNFFPPFEYLSDYVFNSQGFTGTSASAPLASGLAALALAANPDLTARDVQILLALASRHFDTADPDLRPNGAGLLASHQVGFGIPDAAEVVRLARRWPAHRVPVRHEWAWTGPLPIPDAGLRVETAGEGVPSLLASVPGRPSLGLVPDEPTDWLALADLGRVLSPLETNITGRAALIERGVTDFSFKIQEAARVGAAFAVVSNSETSSNPSCGGGDQLCTMGSTDFVPIPAVFIGYTDGAALRNVYSTNALARSRLVLQAASVEFTVTNTLACHWAGAHVATDHPRRADLRVTLVSPAGTRSVLQRFNNDTNAGPAGWTYWSCQHLLESTPGTWRLEVADQDPHAAGNLLSASLILEGEPIVDIDADGLDDDWEQEYLATLAFDAMADPDGDGFNNAREQAMGTEPALRDRLLEVDLSVWSTNRIRLAWPGNGSTPVTLDYGDRVDQPDQSTSPVPAKPETEVFLDRSASNAFFRLRTP